MPRSDLLCLIQARTNSSRLTGKSLLSISGFPLAVLVAKRLGNHGHSTVLLTSDRSWDDELAQTVRDHGLDVYRGDLDNVLSRFLSYTKHFPDDLIIVRATADNPYPDGSLIDIMREEFERSDAYYMQCEGPPSNAPIGLSLEMFRLSALRRSLSGAESEADFEHVTPSLRRNGPLKILKLDDINYEGMKVGVDTFDDFVRVAKAFRSVKDPILAPFRELCMNTEKDELSIVGKAAD